MLIGITGKPSVGKSAFFKAATLAEVDIASHPFTTIKPNHAMGYVRVKCPAENIYNKKCNPREGYCLDGERFVPIELLDVAGLVPGAHEGKGLGNQFLSDLASADVLLHIIDVSGSTNEKGEQVEDGSHDVTKDIEFLEEELDLWFYDIFQKVWGDLSKRIAAEKDDVRKAIFKQFSGLKITEDQVQQALKESKVNTEDVRSWKEEELKSFCKTLRQLSKPMIIVANKMDQLTSEKNLKLLQKTYPNKLIIPCSAESELALKLAAKKEIIDYVPGDDKFSITNPDALNPEQDKALDNITKYLDKYKSTGVQEALNKSVFEFLEYMAIFPGGMSKLEDSKGNVLPDCFLLPKGSTALDFAYTIHSDLGEKFIKAMDVKSKRTVGKTHPLKHGDIVEILTSK